MGSGTLDRATSVVYVTIKHPNGYSSLAAEPGATPKGHPSARARVWRVILFIIACGCWLACSSGIIIVNKYIIKDIAFSYPLALSALGQAVSCLGAWFVCDVVQKAPPAEVDAWLFITRIVPIGIGQGMGIWLSNKLYLYLTVSFIEMARSSVPLLTMAALWLVGLEQPNRPRLAAVVVAGMGSCISAWGEAALSVPGLMLLLLSFAIEVARMVMLQHLIQGLNLGAWQSVKYMALPAAVSLTFMTIVMEAAEMINNDAVGVVLAHVPAFVAAGSLGLAVNYVSNAVIQLSTATTLKLLAAVRGPIIVLAAVLMFAEKVTRVQLVGYSLAVFGFGAYNWLLARQGARRAPVSGASQVGQVAIIRSDAALSDKPLKRVSSGGGS